MTISVLAKHPFWQLLGRDLRLATRQGSATLTVVMFFVVTVTLFPLSVGPELNILARIAAGVVWVAALLAALLSLDRLFQADFEDGSLDLILLGPLSAEGVVAAKCTAHWLTTGLPLILTAPILGLLMNLGSEGFAVLVASMVIGTPALSLIGALGAALTVGVRRGGLLMSLLVLPLYIPVLIFGVAGVEATLNGLSAKPHLMILGAITLFAAVIGPWAAGAALRLSVSE